MLPRTWQHGGSNHKVFSVFHVYQFAPTGVLQNAVFEFLKPNHAPTHATQHNHNLLPAHGPDPTPLQHNHNLPIPPLVDIFPSTWLLFPSQTLPIKLETHEVEIDTLAVYLKRCHSVLDRSLIIGNSNLTNASPVSGVHGISTSETQRVLLPEHKSREALPFVYLVDVMPRGFRKPDLVR